MVLDIGETPGKDGLTITTTVDCNLGCYYCYEDRSTDALSREEGDVDAIVAMARRMLVGSGKRRLHVDWYGGEPLLRSSAEVRSECTIPRPAVIQFTAPGLIDCTTPKLSL